MKRVIIKLSGEALCEGSANNEYNDKIVARLANEIASLVRDGVEAGLVVGGGNYWRGRDTKSGFDRAKSDYIGMMGTIMNGLYLSEAFRKAGMPVRVMTPFAVSNFTELFVKEAAVKALAEGTALIFAGGTGLPFFSTDTTTALKACELEAETVLFAKNVDGVYSADPNKDAKAVKYDRLSYSDIIEKNLKAIDIPAISLLRDAGIKSRVFGLGAEGSIISAAKASDDEFIKNGTLVCL